MQSDDSQRNGDLAENPFSCLKAAPYLPGLRANGPAQCKTRQAAIWLFFGVVYAN